MTIRLVELTALSEQDRKTLAPLAELTEGDQVELRVQRHDGQDQTWLAPPAAAKLVGTLVSLLASGQRVAVLAQERELNPSEAAAVLGIPRPLVIHRMNIGDLPFRQVGKRRRVLLKDVLTLKARLDVQQKALRALAEDAEDLMTKYGL